jgi:zinc protease
MTDRTIAPEFNQLQEIKIIEAETTYLDNKIPLHIINAGTQPVVKIEFLFKAGAWFEKVPGTSFLTTKLLLEGTSKKNSKEISNYFDQFGASVDLNPGLDFVSVSIYCLSKFLKDIIPLIHEILNDSTFPDDEITTQKNLKIQNLKVNNEKNNILAAKYFRKNLFGSNHPYGHAIEIEEIEKIKRDDLTSFYEGNFKNNFEIVISGRIDSDHLKMLNEYFGKIKSEKSNNPVNYKLSEKTVGEIIVKEKSLQSSIRIGRRMFTKNHPDYIKFIFVNEVLGGYFGSRLMKNIREDKGFTYGISSSILTFKNEGFFAIGTDVKKENTRQTIDEINKEMKILRTNYISEEELSTVKNYMLGSFMSDINTPFSLADKFKSIYFNGLSYDFYQEYINTINSITKKDVIEVATKYLMEDDMIEIIVGGEN